MVIAHVALWTGDLDRAVAFWLRYFDAEAGPLYESRRRPFRSRFLSFATGCRLEIMESPEVASGAAEGGDERLGWGHVAIEVADGEAVDRLAARMAADGVSVPSPPRWTGDGYYEALVLDPEGNRVEIVAAAPRSLPS